MTELRNGIYNIANAATNRLLDVKSSTGDKTRLSCTQNGSNEGTQTQEVTTSSSYNEHLNNQRTVVAVGVSRRIIILQDTICVF